MTYETFAEGIEFIAQHEGFVGRAYFCPANKLTIGYGFTNSSQVFHSYWKQKHGRGLKVGDTITREEAQEILRRLVNEEYGGELLEKKLGPNLKQHEADAATSVSYNVGPRVLGWKWAKALKAGNVSLAADRLETTAVTARGVKLRGLVNRRKQEAELLEFGKYKSHVSGEGVRRTITKRKTAYDPVVEDVQGLLTARGLSPGVIDGWFGTKTKQALLEYQRSHPHLANDGIIGPATIAQLRRDAAAAREGLGGATFGGFSLLAFINSVHWSTYMAIGAVAIGAYLLYTHRVSIKRKLNQIGGHVQP